jgi:hypothetical protein
VIRIGHAALILVVACAQPLLAQPWVPPPGEGTVSITYQNYYVTGHFDLRGRENKNGATHSKALLAELDFGLTETIGLTVTLPYIASKYTGPDVYFVGGIPTFPGPLDDRTYHGTFQDLRVEARRMFLTGPLAVAPFAGVTLPTHDYETRGEAVPGKGRRDLQLGAGLGADLNPFLPRTYMHARYGYAVAERKHGFPSVRSTIDLEGGHDVTSRVGLRGLLAWQIRHKGPTLDALAAHDWEGHDRFIVPSYFNVGGGASVRLTRTTELSALWMATISGKGGAHVARMLAIGATWSFGGGLGGLGGGASQSRRSSTQTGSATPLAVARMMAHRRPLGRSLPQSVGRVNAIQR